MKNRIRTHLLMIFLSVSIPMLLSSLLFAQDNQPKRVLILHSYHRGLSWDDAIDRGIESVFEESDLNIETQIEYMDSKRIHSAGYLRQLLGIYKTKLLNPEALSSRFTFSRLSLISAGLSSKVMDPLYPIWFSFRKISSKGNVVSPN